MDSFLPIGYLITEATTIWLNTKGCGGRGSSLAYEFSDRLRIGAAAGHAGRPVACTGTAASCRVGDDVVVRRHGAASMRSRPSSSRGGVARLLGYVLDEALFTTPAHPIGAAQR